MQVIPWNSQSFLRFAELMIWGDLLMSL
jgi:hypothetical protein